MSEPLALERNLALMAGAGAGKTHSLMTLCLHLLSGAREGAEALRPSKLCLVTFTDKAASEMKTRLWSRVDALANGARVEEKEPELWATLQRLGRSTPSVAQWRGIRDELGTASIGTFHGLCLQLLRRSPVGLGNDGGVELLDEGEATELLEDVAERVVLKALEEGEPEVSDLCRELQFRGPGQASGLQGGVRERSRIRPRRKLGLREEIHPALLPWPRPDGHETTRVTGPNAHG